MHTALRAYLLYAPGKVCISNKHLKKSNAACFYTPIVLKLLIIVQMWKQHEEGNLSAIILTPHLSKLIKYWQFYGVSKVKNTHFHCCSKSYRPYWLAQYYGGLFEPLITSCWFSYVIQFVWFPNVWKWTDGYLYTSFAYLKCPIWFNIIMNLHSCIKHANKTTSLIYR